MTDLEEMKLAELPTNDPTNPAHRLAKDLQAGLFKNKEVADDVAFVLAALLRRNSPTVDDLVGYANHDDDCTVNRYPGTDACSCGLSAILQRARHERTGE